MSSKRASVARVNLSKANFKRRQMIKVSLVVPSRRPERRLQIGSRDLDSTHERGSELLISKHGCRRCLCLASLRGR